MTRETALYLMGPEMGRALASDRQLFAAAVARAYERGDHFKLTLLRALRPEGTR